MFYKQLKINILRLFLSKKVIHIFYFSYQQMCITKSAVFLFKTQN